jgi:uncharacterized protein
MAKIIKKEKVYYVQGMHCASCKKIIEDRLNSQKSVRSVTVDLQEESVRIVFDHGGLDIKELTQLFDDVEYRFSLEPKNSFDYKKTLGAFIIALIVFIALMQSEKFMMMTSVRVDENASIITFLILGAVASFSSCVALVGGIILSMTKTWSQKKEDCSLYQKMEPHVAFHIGRLIAYVLGGSLLGLFGGLFSMNDPAFSAILIFVVSIIMFVIGLQMIGVKSVAVMYSRVHDLLQKRFKVSHNIKDRSPFIIGALTFFLPCGFTLIAQGAALASGDPLMGAAILGAFALGSLPMLMGISFSGVTLLSKKRFANLFNIIVGTIIIVFALYTINGQLNVLGLPSFSDLSFATQTNERNDNVDVTPPEEQELRLVADGFEYTIIGSHELVAGVPTTMIIDNQGIAGCGAYMAARGLFDGWIELKPGLNEISFVPEKGTYKITCTMGMVPPVTIIVK